ncbi:DUF4123 domain-containing protein [Chitinimonas sp. PSY-7]|uniref:DUF4123 domain-containing protein n=1 Tax=Chitinimonas sp. PSY-7 TaxID=3459088 RepID=UPI0040403714
METAEQLRIQVTYWLSQPRPANIYHYLLLDHAAIPALIDWLNQAQLPYRPLWDTVNPREPHALPLLVVLPVASMFKSIQFIRQLAQGAAMRNAITCIASPLDFPTLRRALAKRTEAAQPNRRNAMLRYFDTRILPELLALLTKTQAKAFLGFASNLAYANRYGVLCNVPVTFQPEAWQSPFPLDEVQHSQLDSATMANTVLDVMQREMPSQIASLNPGERYTLAYAAVAQARSLGLDTISDFVLMTLLHQNPGPTQLDNPIWQAGFSQVKAGEITLANLVASTVATHA